MGTTEVDTLRPTDYAQWAELWRQYLEFYHTTRPDEQYQNTWSRILDPKGNLEAFVIRDVESGNLLGLAHYMFHTSSWFANDMCYLNDLFVLPSTRGKGYGRQLIEATAKAARAKKSSAFYWLTAHDNSTARALYDKMGKCEFVYYRMPLD